MGCPTTIIRHPEHNWTLVLCRCRKEGCIPELTTFNMAFPIRAISGALRSFHASSGAHDGKYHVVNKFDTVTCILYKGVHCTATILDGPNEQAVHTSRCISRGTLVYLPRYCQAAISRSSAGNDRQMVAMLSCHRGVQCKPRCQQITLRHQDDSQAHQELLHGWHSCNK